MRNGGKETEVPTLALQIGYGGTRRRKGRPDVIGPTRIAEFPCLHPDDAYPEEWDPDLFDRLTFRPTFSLPQSAQRLRRSARGRPAVEREF